MTDADLLENEFGPVNAIFAAMGPLVFTAQYLNWRGVKEQRTLRVAGLWFGATQWHPHPGRMLRAVDTMTDEQRDFAVAGFDPDTIRLNVLAFYMHPGATAVRDVMELAKIAYLDRLMQQYAGDRGAVAQHLGCTSVNLTKMLGLLNQKYGGPHGRDA